MQPLDSEETKLSRPRVGLAPRTRKPPPNNCIDVRRPRAGSRGIEVEDDSGVPTLPTFRVAIEVVGLRMPERRGVVGKNRRKYRGVDWRIG
jgi:hypothetical protein